MKTMTPLSRRIIASSALLFAMALPVAGVADPWAEEPVTPPTAPGNIYSQTTADHLSPATRDALPLVYVPNHSSNTVSVIDPVLLKEIDRFKVGPAPQHIVPSWDLQTLWVTNNGNRWHPQGSLTPIDPKTGKPGKSIPVTDPYNMYFTPDGSSAIVVDEAYRQLDFRDPHTMALKSVLPAPDCRGINHADYAADNSYAIFTCEFSSGLLKVDIENKKVLGYLPLSIMGMPQDIRLSADGKVFYVADMMSDGVYLIDGDAFKEVGFIPTGIGTHGFAVSRDGTKLYVSNRGSNEMMGKPKGPGGVSVIDFATRTVIAQWPIPGGGSPDMGNVSADGKQLWLSGRFDSEVYMFDTTTGAVTRIPVGIEPHGLTVWPQPGRYSQGHTGNMR
jgi:YVTN family beta-propeller protein